ncbi:CRISPR-associated protein Csc1 [Candidatus Vecturithrix granuli]|uniref:CRISPR-associated protein Csc1 n=1 Tax=Vecturithrix granuli TaxID=1499967 RepID=A0A081CA95_VECG1|nr:CRISPR-associated protein Csc1 [Candidatus Vecturithrix granuli]
MHIYHCELQLHDVVFYATREMGRLYETEKYFHNFALTYALQLAQPAYHIDESVPQYRQDFTLLNLEGIYVTPAKPIQCDFLLHTFKFANVNYHVEMEKPKKNIPGYGRVKELAPQSRFSCYVLSQKALKLPHWIRLGKWMGKAAVTIEEMQTVREKEGECLVTHPLNPLDVAFTPQRYDLISMPPVSLIHNVSFEGAYYEITGHNGSKITLPRGMKYFVT